ncbi:MAG: Hpt domain-containing protein [Succinivibrionaceae bacterium]|nr:Hpt domain-containing protein [Succinivibrionaceae bacterium]
MTELLDTKVLTQMAGDVGFEVLPQLISVFVYDSTQKLSQFRKLYDAGDWSGLAMEAHTLKSVCATYGAMMCRDEAIAFEKLCRAAEPDRAAISGKLDSLLGTLKESIAAVSGFSLK